ncbi:hypothetical protein ACVWY2_001368 [Bradyrhizobium sp. JR6.1]
MVADPADMAEGADRLAGVLEQRLLEGGIGPGLGDDPGAVMRADLRLIGLHDGVERGSLDVAFLGQDRFQRAHAQFGLRQFGMVVIVVVMIMFAHARRIGETAVLCRGKQYTTMRAGRYAWLTM